MKNKKMVEKKSKKDTSKSDFYFTILELLKQNKIPSQISSKLNISKQRIYYYTRILKKLGFIKKENNVWIVLKSKKEDLEHALNWRDKKIRGHAFIWKIKPTRDYDWKRILEKNNLKYNLVRGYTPRIFINNKKVWLGKDSIIIYENKSFYGKNAIESRKYAVFGMQETIRQLQTKLGIKFSYYFKPTREHFGMIKNELARQCNERGEKIIVRDELDGEWLWIDDSEGMFGELETGGKGFTQDRAGLNLNVQNWYNDHKKHKFKVTPSFLIESLNKLTQVQLIEQQNKAEYSRDLLEHKEAIKKMGNNTEANTKSIELLAEVVKQLADKIEKL